MALLRTALGQGGNAGFLLGVGSSVGDLVYFTLAVLGSAALLQWSPVRLLLWGFGTSILVFFTWRMAREVVHPKSFDIPESSTATPQTWSELMATGLGLALASPTSILWFAAIGGSIIASLGRDGSLAGFAAGFAIAGVARSALIAYGAASLRGLLGRQLIRALSLISALLFLYFAVFVFVRGLQML